ncbi:hypothetical protein HDU89_007690 [Geranomyces variabilis]|nr:hypothetical protein HDU89_007690 [Geranomyces variabilis]
MAVPDSLLPPFPVCELNDIYRDSIAEHAATDATAGQETYVSTATASLLKTMLDEVLRRRHRLGRCMTFPASTLQQPVKRSNQDCTQYLKRSATHVTLQVKPNFMTLDYGKGEVMKDANSLALCYVRHSSTGVVIPSGLIVGRTTKMAESVGLPFGFVVYISSVLALPGFREASMRILLRAQLPELEDRLDGHIVRFELDSVQKANTFYEHGLGFSPIGPMNDVGLTPIKLQAFGVNALKRMQAAKEANSKILTMSSNPA